MPLLEALHHLVEQPRQLQVFTHPDQRRLRRDSQLVQVFAQVVAGGLGPVDRPGVGNMGAVGMRHVRRQHQQVAGAHGVKLPRQLAPPAAFDAIDKNRLADCPAGGGGDGRQLLGKYPAPAASKPRKSGFSRSALAITGSGSITCCCPAKPVPFSASLFTVKS